MSSLEQSLKELERDLVAHPMRIAAHSEMPFAILRYDPTEEFALRRQLRLLTFSLAQNHHRTAVLISLSRLVWKIVEKCEGTEYLFKTEQLRGVRAAQEHINRLLSSQDYRPIGDELMERIQPLDNRCFLFLRLWLFYFSEAFEVNMAIWEYNDRVLDKELIRNGLSQENCLFCKTKMSPLHSRTQKHGSRNGPRYTGEELSIKTCVTCGWWIAREYHYERNKRGRCSRIPRAGHRLYGDVALLSNLDLSDISIPIQEVRDFLAAKYDHRGSVHPRRFEETVASVFRDLGYQTRVTAYSGDGGIDVVLDGGVDIEIGVQVKRYKESISVEQIRSFTGALWLSGYTKGIYVTTSRFESGANKLASLAMLKGIQVELVDAPKFYDALKIAQRNVYRCKEEIIEKLEMKPLTLLEQGGKW